MEDLGEVKYLQPFLAFQEKKERFPLISNGKESNTSNFQIILSTHK
jgi:hypothetical protein